MSIFQSLLLIAGIFLFVGLAVGLLLWFVHYATENW